jgi:hypothetical protein
MQGWTIRLRPCLKCCNSFRYAHPSPADRTFPRISPAARLSAQPQRFFCLAESNAGERQQLPQCSRRSMGVTCYCYCCGRCGCVDCPCLVELQGQAVRLRLFRRQGLLPLRAASFQQRRRQACRLYHAQPPICDAHQPEWRRSPICVTHSNAPAQRHWLCFYSPSHTCRPRRGRQPSRQASVGMHKRLHRNFSRSPCLHVTISVTPPSPRPPARTLQSSANAGA